MKVVRKTNASEAEQYNGPATVERAATDPPAPGGVVFESVNGSTERYPLIKTVEGTHVVEPGDWIVTNPDGQQSLCRERLFEERFAALAGGVAGQLEAGFRRLLMDEYSYWRKVESPEPGWEMDLVAMGAMAAAANVLGATLGCPAPWHASRRKPQGPGR